MKIYIKSDRQYIPAESKYGLEKHPYLDTFRAVRFHGQINHWIVNKHPSVENREMFYLRPLQEK